MSARRRRSARGMAKTLEVPGATSSAQSLGVSVAVNMSQSTDKDDSPGLKRVTMSFSMACFYTI